MVIHFLKEDSLAALKANAKGNMKYYENPENHWIYEYFDGDNPFAEYKLQIGDFQFRDTGNLKRDGAKNDVENAIRLYGAMKGLSDTQAADERLWAGLCHGDFWEYLHNRWAGNRFRGDPETLLLRRYFFHTRSGARRALFMNTLSRLWWLGRLTFDEKRKDPFELTRYWEEDFSTKSLILFSSNYTGNAEITRGLISALIEMERSGFSLGTKKRDTYYQASQYLNVYGGTHILDYYNAEEIKEKVLRYMWGLAGRVPPGFADISAGTGREAAAPPEKGPASETGTSGETGASGTKEVSEVSSGTADAAGQKDLHKLWDSLLQ